VDKLAPLEPVHTRLSLNVRFFEESEPDTDQNPQEQCTKRQRTT
jgi:hypothetical protein